MTSDLLPCPFCGGEALLHRTPGFGKLFRVSCKNCDASPSSGLGESEAVRKWNTRHAPASADEIVKAAEEWVEAERTMSGARDDE